MELKSEQEKTSGYVYDQNDIAEVFFFGDFLRKTSHLLRDSDEKWKIVCRATEVQNTEWPTLQSYHNELKKVEKDLIQHVSTNQDPFTIS